MPFPVVIASGVEGGDDKDNCGGVGDDFDDDDDDGVYYL